MSIPINTALTDCLIFLSFAIIKVRRVLTVIFSKPRSRQRIIAVRQMMSVRREPVLTLWARGDTHDSRPGDARLGCSNGLNGPPILQRRCLEVDFKKMKVSNFFFYRQSR